MEAPREADDSCQFDNPLSTMGCQLFAQRSDLFIDARIEIGQRSLVVEFSDEGKMLLDRLQD